MGPQDIVDTLAALTKAVARIEGRVEELAAATEAAADRAENAAERAAGSAEAVTSTARTALAQTTSLQGEASVISRTAAKLELAADGLAETPVPAWRWLFGSLGAGVTLALLVEVAAWPLVRPLLTTTVLVAMPTATAGTAPPTAREAPQGTPRDRGHAR